MSKSENTTLDTRKIIETSIKVVLLGAIILWSLMIVRPFLVPVLWGIILAVAMEPVIARFTRILGGRRTLAAVLFVLVFIAVLIVPTALLVTSSIDTVQNLSAHVLSETTLIPPPPAKVADWPLIGGYVHQVWSLAASNLEGALKQFAPQIKTGLGILLGYIGGGLAGIAMAFISTGVAGFFMAKAEKSALTAQKLALRLVGEKATSLLSLTTATIRSVMQGVVGVAFIQASLSAVGMFAIGLPGAGIWVVLVLLVAICQLPVLLVLGPITAYVFTYASSTAAIIFLIWILIVGSSDNILKPLLMGRGVDIPMLVILIGSLGGLIHSGIIGLFVGSVVLAIMYTLIKTWLDEDGSEINEVTENSRQ